ncbi:MAG: methylenetetrahydrofolate reductase [Pseudomonadota bacterium]
MNSVLQTQPAKDQESEAIARFMTGFSVETTPTAAAKMSDFRTILRPGTAVSVTFLPGADYRDSVAAAKRLREQGFHPVPHFAARSLASPEQFKDYLERAVGEADVNAVLAIAGGVEKPLGPYASSMDLLESGLFDKHDITSIGVAGHPEGSPDISDEAIREAISWKNAFAQRSDAALHIVTQFCFEAEPIIAWDRRLNAEGNRLPIRIGIPGIAKLSTLIKYAAACGVGNSIRFLKRQGAGMTNFLSLQAPDKLVRDLAAYAANDSDCAIEGVHMYPLGGLTKTAKWSYVVADGAIAIRPDSGFDVAADIG